MKIKKNNQNKVLLILLIGILMVIPAKAQEIILVDVNIPEGYRHLVPGEPVFAETQIILIGRDQTDSLVDVVIEYSVKDKENNVITKITETKGGIVRIQATKELHLPADLVPGIYSVTVKASYKGIAETGASTTFEVVKSYAKETSLPQDIKSLLIIIIAIMLIFFLFSAYQFWKIAKFTKKSRRR